MVTASGSIISRVLAADGTSVEETVLVDVAAHRGKNPVRKFLSRSGVEKLHHDHDLPCPDCYAKIADEGRLVLLMSISQQCLFYVSSNYSVHNIAHPA